MNKVILIGRLTNEPELRYTGNNVAVTTFSIAVNRTFTNQNGERETDFFNVIAWKKLAETVKNYLKKGHRVGIEGSLQSRTYEDNNGQKRHIVEVVASGIEFLEPKKDDKKDNFDSNLFEDFGQSITIPDEDLPFN